MLNITPQANRATSAFIKTIYWKWSERIRKNLDTVRKRLGCRNATSTGSYNNEKANEYSCNAFGRKENTKRKTNDYSQLWCWM